MVSANEEKKQIERAYEKQFEWERVCDIENKVLGQELVQFVLGKERWDLKDVLGEVIVLAASC